MTTKRPSLRGKGAEIFLGGDSTESTKSVSEVVERVQIKKAEKPAAPIVEKTEKEKATFYLPVDVLEDLENVWHDVRKVTHRKIKKSDIVSIALAQVALEFKEWQNEERKNCTLIKRLDKR
jgi:hypothetical protein